MIFTVPTDFNKKKPGVFGILLASILKLLPSYLNSLKLNI